MFSRVRSSSTLGIDAYIVEVETDLDYKLPYFTMVGLAEGAVKESKERVSSAIKNSGYFFPQKRITINLAPANIKKEGSAYDLPIAVGILAADGHINNENLEKYVFAGELSLAGNLKHIPGILSIAVAVRDAGFEGIVLPLENADEASLVKGLDVYPASNLRDVIDFLADRATIEKHSGSYKESFIKHGFGDIDFSDVKGQSHVKRAIEVAAAGGHNILMIGPPGSGKTMLARRIPTILPEMTMDEAFETTKIHSVAGLINNGVFLVTERPFRSPHHTISDAALIGGGIYPRPGEVSLAHNGVLFLDEIPELGKKTIETLRQPIEDGFVNIARSSYSVNFPASFMLVASMNPCPCGFLTDPKHECGCSQTAIQRYMSKVSGPIMDRIDIHIEVPPVHYSELLDDSHSGERSCDIVKRVNASRNIQRNRYKEYEGIHSNSQLKPQLIKHFCKTDVDAERILRKAIDSFGFSARAYHRILKVSRTIADLDGEEIIGARHISEAVQYRTLDRNLWIK